MTFNLKKQKIPSVLIELIHDGIVHFYFKVQHDDLEINDDFIVVAWSYVIE